MRKVEHDFPRDPIERQSCLAILFNRRNLSQDEDLAAVHWRNCRARIRPTYGGKPLPQA
jgi:hypothetical protein